MKTTNIATTNVWGQIEVCPHCESENWFPFWDVDEKGFVAVCENCGEEIFLCDACSHHEDNPEVKCDWCCTADGGKCFRGITKWKVLPWHNKLRN